MNRDRLGIWEERTVSNAMLVVRGAAIALSLAGILLMYLNVELIERSLYTYGIWAVPPLGAIAGLLLFGLIWGGKPIVRRLTVTDNG